MMMTNSLLQALRTKFRQKGITYRDAAKALKLSEVSIKRLFSDQNCSLKRFEQLCEFAGTELGELMAIVESQQQQLSELTLQQEQKLVSNTSLLLVAVCIINHWSFDEILARYRFTTAELTGMFTQLDKLGIIELQPANRYRLRISRSFKWQPRGPIQTFFVQSIQQAYLQENVDNSSNHFRFVWGMLARESVDELNRKIARLIDEYLKIVEQDVRIPVDDKLTSSLLIMFREDWQPAPFKQLLRES